MDRQQKPQIIKDLGKKIVFLVGPRQVGKTWLAKEIGRRYAKSVYLNYDRFEDQEIIRKEQWLKDTELLILDELHKMKGWKNFLKGVYDTKPERLKILVTGSTRLETFRQSGDSLAGRFFVHHLLPFSPAEIKKIGAPNSGKFGLERFLSRGGFPEPFLAAKAEDADRWRNQYIDGLIRTDILDFEKIHDFKAIKLIFELLRRKVGSSVSYSSLAQDAGISPATAKKYVAILEALYIVFTVSPYSKKIARSISKEPKIYFYDNGLVIADEGKKLENLVAVSLLKNVLGKNDYTGRNLKLQYLRTKEGKEVDFVLTDDGQRILEMIEVKTAESVISKNLQYFSDKYEMPAKQIIKDLKREREVGRIKVLRAQEYLESMYL